jgi:hypothetical protein
MNRDRGDGIVWVVIGLIVILFFAIEVGITVIGWRG